MALLGRTMCSVLLDRINSGNPERATILDVELVRRGSA
jgi:DNA-binding LacI/PurR family transcriptional regulator